MQEYTKAMHIPVLHVVETTTGKTRDNPPKLLLQISTVREDQQDQFFKLRSIGDPLHFLLPQDFQCIIDLDLAEDLALDLRAYPNQDKPSL
ncbi:MAG: hypothetical protein OXH16_15220 [Gemmatimonadetes bacterium]|nr:hypothetical protein [Gemmatimonadota bacterium]